MNTPLPTEKQQEVLCSCVRQKGVGRSNRQVARASPGAPVLMQHLQKRVSGPERKTRGFSFCRPGAKADRAADRPAIFDLA